MSRAENQTLPVEMLSDADKDALILRLWRDLQAERERSKEMERRLAQTPGNSPQDEREAGALLKQLQQAGGERRGSLHAPATLQIGLGASFAFMRSKGLIIAAALVAFGFALDFTIGRYQRYRLEQKRLAELTLQHAAFEGMFAEVVNVAYEPDQKSYRLTMKFTNDEPGHLLYVMKSPVRAFVQSGLSWREVPSRDPHGEAARVVKLTDSYSFETIFEPNVKEWTELMPGYMHIRFESNSLISQRSDPDDDIIDRTDRYYVYLKPHGADDRSIRERLKIKGDPPIYMPMPPH
jgi:hypothetical protein